MTETRGLLIVLCCAVFAGYWLLLAESLSFPPAEKVVTAAPKLKTAKMKRAKKGKK